MTGELTDGTSPYDTEALKYLNKVYQGIIAGNNLFDVSCSEPWVWAQRKNPLVLTLNPAVTGSATMTNGSSAGVFSSAPTTSLEGRYFVAQGDLNYYRISTHTASSTAFQIDQPFLGGSGSTTYSAYQYDYDAVSDSIIINSKCNKIDFSEGGAQITATLTSGTYTPTTLCAEIASKMTAASGARTYTATFNSITRKFTIVQGGTTFSLLFGSGTNAFVSASGVLGYNIEDQTSAVTYTSQYALSAICRISKPITVYQSAPYYDEAARDSNKIFMIDDNTFLRDFPLNRIMTQVPNKFCPVAQTGDGIWTLRFNGCVQEELRIEINDIPVARDLVDNVNSFPLLPGTFSDVLIYGAAYHIASDKADTKMAEFGSKAQAQLKAMIEFNRQGSHVAGNNFGKIIPRQGQTRRWGTGKAY